MSSQVVLGMGFSISAQVTLVTVWQCWTSTGTNLTLGLSTQCSVVTSRQACFTVATAEWATTWAAGASHRGSTTSLQIFSYSISSVSTTSVVQTFSAVGVQVLVTRISFSVTVGGGHVVG